jgi:biotin-(acetyl-CoA carboxylase) ligase
MLLRLIENWYSILCGKEGPTMIVYEWSRRSSYANGKNVRIRLTGESFFGVTDGLEANGALRVLALDGSPHVVHAGDVEQVRPSEQFD